MGRKMEVATSLNIASTTDSETNFTPKLLFKAPVRPKAKKSLNASIRRPKPHTSMKTVKKEPKCQSLAKQQLQKKQNQIQLVIESQKEALKRAPKIINKSKKSKRELVKKEKSKIDESRSKPYKNIDNIIQESLIREYNKKKIEKAKQQQEAEERKKRMQQSKNIGNQAREKIAIYVKPDNESPAHKAPWGVDQRKYKPIAISKCKPISDNTRQTYSPPARSISKLSNDKMEDSIMPQKKVKQKQKRKGIDRYIKVKHSRMMESIEKEKALKHKKTLKIKKNLLQLSNYAKKVATTYKSAEKPKEPKKNNLMKKSKTPQNFYERYIKMFSELDAEIYSDSNIQGSNNASTDKDKAGKSIKLKLAELAYRYEHIKKQTKDNDKVEKAQKYNQECTHANDSRSVQSGVVQLNIIPADEYPLDKKITHLSVIQNQDDEPQETKMNEDDEVKHAKDLDKKLTDELTSMQHQLYSSDISDGEKKVLLQYIKKTKNETKLESREIQTEERKALKKPTLSIQVSDLNDSKSEDVKPQSDHRKKNDSFNSASLIEMRLLCGNEKLVRENSLRVSQTPKSYHIAHNSAKFKWETERSVRLYDIVEEHEHNGPFDRNSFGEFTFKKFKDILKEDNLTKIVKLREHAYKFKEQAEKNYIQNMFETRQLSPKTYFSKRMEIEKWVSKEKEDIKKSKKQIAEQYKKTQKMIEDAHDNALRIKKLISNCAMPDQQSNHSADITENFNAKKDESTNQIKEEALNDDNPENQIDKLADQLDKDVSSVIEYQANDQQTNDYLAKEKEKEQNTESITSDVMKDILKELMSNLFPPRILSESESSGEVDLVSYPKLFDENNGIKIDKDSVCEFLEIIIGIIISDHPDVYSTVITPKEYSMISKLSLIQGQCNEIDFFKLLIENTPILNEEIFEKANKVYLEMAPNDKQSLGMYQKSHNKVVFDALNEALNLLRPYGKFGVPPIWSIRQRSAYLQSEDASFIYSNAKEIVMEYVTMEAGVLPCKEFMSNGKFDEEHFAEVREKHLANVLGQEVLDIEDLWINYENEEAQVKLDIADMILDGLVTETVQILNNVNVK